LAIAAIIAICIGGPIVEMFDQWDDTLRTGNDTEANMVIVALCVGFALSVTGIIVAKLRAGVGRSHPSSSLCRSLQIAFTPLARPIPNSRPPTVLRV
jgi:hypothetical protein